MTKDFCANFMRYREAHKQLSEHLDNILLAMISSELNNTVSTDDAEATMLELAGRITKFNHSLAE